MLPAFIIAQKHKIAVSVLNAAANQISNGYTPTLTDSLPSSTPGKPPRFLNDPVHESPKYGFKVTVLYERTLSNHFSIFSGLNYSYSGFTTGKQHLLFMSQYAPGRGFVFPAVETYSTVSYTYSYYQAGLPIGVNYFFNIKKLKFYTGAGVSVNYLSKVNQYTTLYFYNNDKTLKETASKSLYRDFNVAAQVHFGAEFNLKSAFTLRVAPQFQYTFTNIAAKNAGYKIHPYMAGLEISVVKDL